MFHIYLSGHIKNKKQVENFCDKVLHHFFKNRIKRDIDIDIRITKSLSDGTAGGCYGDHESIVIEIAKGVQVPNQRYMLYDYKEVIVTLAHELVHAKQHIRKQKFQCPEREFEAYNLEYDLYDLYWD
tara:strand:- start:656 stop:1036 length:381 start_codon:yes stop_codon:yes gene_type:complete